MLQTFLGIMEYKNYWKELDKYLLVGASKTFYKPMLSHKAEVKRKKRK